MSEKRDTKTCIDRLTKLADYLDTLPSRRFKLTSWGLHNHPTIDTKDDTIAKPVSQIIREVKEGACGTTACACGHAAMIPEFRRLGLSLDFTIPDKYDDHSSAGFYYRPNVYTQYDGFRAAHEFFKLDSYNDALILFDPNMYPYGRKGKSYVIKRIRAYIRTMQKKLNQL